MINVTIPRIRLTVFDWLVICVGVAYMAQYPILTFFEVPPANAAALADGLKDLRGALSTIIGAYIMTKVKPRTGEGEK